MLQSTGASDLAILEALDDALIEIASGPLERYVEVHLPAAGGADDPIRATVHEDRLWADTAAAGYKRLLGSTHCDRQP